MLSQLLRLFIVHFVFLLCWIIIINNLYPIDHFHFQVVYECVEQRGGSSLTCQGTHAVTSIKVKAKNLFLPFFSHLLTWYSPVGQPISYKEFCSGSVTQTHFGNPDIVHYSHVFDGPFEDL